MTFTELKHKGVALWKSFAKSLKSHSHVQFMIFGLILILLGYFSSVGIFPSFYLSVFAYIIIFTIVALGLNLLLGFSGLISLASSSFIGVGALGTGIFLNLGLPFEIAAMLAILSAAFIGALIGLLSSKISGVYLAIATLFIAEILRQIFTSVAIFGGERLDIGEVNLLGFIKLSRIDRAQRFYLYTIMTVVLALMMMAVYNIIKSRSGRAFMGISRSENSAAAMGISPLKYRVMAFTIATFFAAVAGVLYALYFQNAPTRQWGLLQSLTIIAIVVVGGFKSIYGMFFGAVIIHGMSELFLKDWLGNVSNVFSGVLLIVVILFYPNGVAHLWIDIKKLYYKLKAKPKKKDVINDES